MIGTPKPTASLSSGLLARKGQARPAMRPQGFLNLSGHSPDDLGWNDMGYDAPAPAPAPVAPAPAVPVAPVPRPVVLRQREALDRTLAEPLVPVEPVLATPVAAEPVAELPAPEPVAAPAPTPAPALPKKVVERVVREVRAKKSKAAFTLRLDTDRHLRLRLASAVTNRSAQQLVTEALDAFLKTVAEVDALARQVGKEHG